VFDQACEGVLPKVVLKELLRNGWLNTQSGDNDKRLKGRMSVGGQRISGYLISKALLGDSSARHRGTRQRPQPPSESPPEDYSDMPEAHFDIPPEFYSSDPSQFDGPPTE